MEKFSDHIVNKRFREVYEELEKNNLIKGKSDIAKELGTYNHVINSILKGQRNITVDQLNRLFDTYNVNANFLFGNADDMFLAGHSPEGEVPTLSMNERQNEGRQNIALVSQRALAGVGIDLSDESFTENLPHFSIPNLEGELIAFEINGDSMMPTITNGDIVICEKIERGEPLRDNHVYVIVTDIVVAKRIQQIKNRSNQLTSIRLISDNDAVDKPCEVELENVRQILKVKCRLTNYAIA